jgi:hypothetical protein
MKKIPVGIRIDEELMERLHNAIWHLGRGLTITSVTAEALERAVAKLEAQNGGKSFPRRRGEVLRSPLKPKKKSR